MKLHIVFLSCICIVLPSYGNDLNPAQRAAIESLPAAQREAIEKVEAEAQLNIELYGSRPGTRLSLSDRGVEPVNIYAASCVRKILNSGNLIFPKYAREGTVVVSFEVLPVGTIQSPRIIESSGDPVTDAGVERTVLNASPCEPFSGEIKRQAEVIVIRRSFSFVRGK